MNGHQLAERGAERAMAHADRVASTPPTAWRDEAYAQLRTFINFKRLFRHTFMAEDVREFAEKNGCPTPPDGRAWGGVVQRAMRDKLIERVGFAPMKSRNCHANPKSVWRPL